MTIRITVAFALAALAMMFVGGMTAGVAEAGDPKACKALCKKTVPPREMPVCVLRCIKG